MFKLFSMITITLLVLINNSAARAQNLQLNLTPNESKVFENHYLWALTATCTIHCGESKNKIKVSLVKNKGTVNGKNLSIGQATSLVVHNNDSISVSAEPGTQVNLLNLGTDSVQANCST